jgi:hypothetical protein
VELYSQKTCSNGSLSFSFPHTLTLLADSILLAYDVLYTWVISEVLRTVCFLFKNEFILKNTFRGLQCNLIVLYHSGPTFGKVLYCCEDVFVFDASDYSGHLIRHLLNASEAFPTKWFLQFWEQVKVWWAEPPSPHPPAPHDTITPLHSIYVGHFKSSAHCMFSL